MVNLMRYAFEILEEHRDEFADDAELMHILETRRPEDYAVPEGPHPENRRRLRVIRGTEDARDIQARRRSPPRPLVLTA